MKTYLFTYILLTTSLFIGLSSCQSEYERCLKEGQEVVKEIKKIEATPYIHDYGVSIELLKKEQLNQLELLGRVSGHYDLFMKEIYQTSPSQIQNYASLKTSDKKIKI